MKTFDIIGDVHGRASQLKFLLQKLGYRQELTGPGFLHPDPNRQAIFTGDLINRGHEQIETIDLVYAMTQSGVAQVILGNHELGALRWFTSHPLKPETFLLEHTAMRMARYAQFVHHVQSKPKILDRILEWFFSFPLWLDLPEFRVIHACWHSEAMALLRPHLSEKLQVPASKMHQIYIDDNALFEAIEILTSGLETGLPDGSSFIDSGGLPRDRLRLAWWQGPGSYKNRVMTAPEDNLVFPDYPLPPELVVNYDNQKPLFLGHFWLRGNPEPLTDKIACIDYSANPHNNLVAYTWRGEDKLTKEHFTGISDEL